MFLSLINYLLNHHNYFLSIIMSVIFFHLQKKINCFILNGKNFLQKILNEKFFFTKNFNEKFFF
jgi:hypothetical protein